jgi:hypothetical protein
MEYNFYKLFKIAKLEEDWWKNFIFHFDKVISLEFSNTSMNQIANENDISQKTPSIISQFTNGKKYSTSFGQYDINFRFTAVYKERLYECSVKLVFSEYIAHLLNYKSKDVVFEKPFSIPFKGIQLIVQRKEVDDPKYNTHKYTTLGVDDSKKAEYIKIPLDDSIPYIAISKIKNLIMKDKLEYKDSYGYADNEE